MDTAKKDALRKLDELLWGISDDMVASLKREDWDGYDRDDLADIFTHLHGDRHPLIKKYDKLINAIIELEREDLDTLLN